MTLAASRDEVKPDPMLAALLKASAARHHELCPRQVLGVRMGLLAGERLDLVLPRADKRILAIVETDGCFVDGLEAATGCSVGRRTMRIEDFGKVAATFVDIETGEAIRLRPHSASRIRALEFAPGAANRWQAQLIGYQRMPASDLFCGERVRLRDSLERLIGKDGVRVHCSACGEEIINGREVHQASRVVCRACAGEAYYKATEQAFFMPAQCERVELE